MSKFIALLLLLCTCGCGFAQKGNADSLYLRQFTLETKRAYSEAENADALSEQVLDSLLDAMSMGIFASDFMTSPDDRFTIYVVETESCGAYCNSDWVSRLVMKSRKNKVYNPVDFEPVYSIDPLPDGSYLVITSHGSRPAGWYTTTTWSAYVIRLEGEDWKLVPAFESELPYSQTTEEEDNRITELHQEQEFIIGTEQFLRYEEGSHRLVYRYGFAVDLNSESKNALELEGYYEFEEGHFVHQEQTVRKIKWQE